MLHKLQFNLTQSLWITQKHLNVTFSCQPDFACVHMLVPFRYLYYLIIENLGSLLIYLLQVLSLSTESWSYASLCFSRCIIPSVFCLLIGCKMTTTFRFFNSLTRTFHVSASLHFFQTPLYYYPFAFCLSVQSSCKSLLE